MESDSGDSMGDVEYDNRMGNEEEDDFVIDHGYGNVPDEEEGEGIKNQPFDEAVELSDAGVSNEEVETSDDEEELGPPMGMNFAGQDQGMGAGMEDSEEDEDEDDEDFNFQNMQQGASAQQPQYGQGEEEDDDDEEDSDDQGFEIEGAYDPSEFAHLQVNAEVQELFQYITRYKPSSIEIDAMIKPFVPEFIPAVGEVDAFLKIPKPDEVPEDLGLVVLDEPCLNQSDPAILEVKLLPFLKRPGRDTGTVVRSIEGADKNPKQISKWISSIEEAHRMKPSPTVTYTKTMPDIDQLMEAWSPQMEEALKSIELPGPDLDVDLQMYILICCSLIGIPVQELSNGKSFTESLHVLFTLYSDFKENQHFQQNIPAAEPMGDYMQF